MLTAIAGAATALGGLLGGASSLFGNLFGGQSSAEATRYAAKLAYKAQQETNEMNYRLTSEQNALNRSMTYDINNRELTENRYLSNTAHQREVADLRAAGLNPILSANSGATANVPALSVPEQDTPQYGVEGYLQSAKLMGEAEQIRSRALVEALKSVDLKEIFKSSLEAAKTVSQLEKDRADIATSAQKLELARNELDLRGKMFDYSQSWDSFLHDFERTKWHNQSKFERERFEFDKSQAVGTEKRFYDELKQKLTLSLMQMQSNERMASKMADINKFRVQSENVQFQHQRIQEMASDLAKTVMAMFMFKKFMK